MEIIFKNDWMQVFKMGEQYFIEYSSGDLLNCVGEIEVSKEDAEKAQENDQSAHDIIHKYQKH